MDDKKFMEMIDAESRSLEDERARIEVPKIARAIIAAIPRGVRLTNIYKALAIVLFEFTQQHEKQIKAQKGERHGRTQKRDDSD